jgi:Bacterial membrane protein YfhO
VSFGGRAGDTGKGPARWPALAFLTHPAMFRGTDYVKHWQPNQAYIRARLLQGELPLWTPEVGLGRPFLASIDTGVLYPPALLTIAFGAEAGAALLTAAHLAMGALAVMALGSYLGMARAARWLSALAFLAGTHLFVNIHVGAVQYGWSACYMPVAYLLGARLQDRFSTRGLAALALTLALPVLIGLPQIAWNQWLGLGAFLLGRSAGARPYGARAALRTAAAGLGAMAAALLWAFLVSAAQLMPLFELVGQSNRAQPTITSASEGSLPLRMWLALFVPADAISQVPMLTTLFLGAPVVLAGLCGLTQLRDRNVRGLALAAGLAFLVGSGDHTPAFRLLFHVVPGLSSFHFHFRSAIVVMFSLILAGGLFVTRASATRMALGALGATAALLLAGTWWWSARTIPAGAPAGAWLAYRVAMVAGGAAALALCLTRHRRAGLAAVALLSATELGLAIATVKRFGVGPGPFPAERAVVAVLRASGAYAPSGVPPRVFVPYTLIRDNSGLVNGYSTVSGYVPLGLTRVWGYLHESLGLDYPVGQNEFASPEIYRFGPFPYRSMGIVLGWDPESGALRVNPRPDPRAYVAGQAEVVPHWGDAVRRMRNGHDFHRVALLEEPAPPLDAASGAARTVRFQPEEVTLDVAAEGRGLLVVAEPWYPGWRATVNDVAAPVLPANGWMRAVPVPAGRSRVVMSYRSRYLLAGAVISTASIALMVAALVSGRRRTAREA